MKKKNKKCLTGPIRYGLALKLNLTFTKTEEKKKRVNKEKKNLLNKDLFCSRYCCHVASNYCYNMLQQH